MPDPNTTGLGPGFFNTDNLLMPQNAMLMSLAWGLTEMASRGTRKMSKGDLRELVLMGLPVLLCTFFVFLTANWQPHATTGERMLLGIALGVCTVFGHMFAKKTGMHDKIPFLKVIMAEPQDEKNSSEPKKDA
jgi:hypothetical protein